MALLILIAVVAGFNVIGICWYKMVTSEAYRTLFHKIANLGESLKRATKSFKGEPQEGTVEFALNYYGLETPEAYRKEKRVNRDGIQYWVNGLKARKGMNITWSFVDKYIDKIYIDFEGKRYTADITFKPNLDGTKTVTSCTACAGKEIITIEGAKDQRPGFNIEAAIGTDLSFRYLQSVKEDVLKNGEAELNIAKLLGFKDFDEVSSEISLKDMEEIKDLINSYFYSYSDMGDGKYTVYGLLEALEEPGEE